MPQKIVLAFSIGFLCSWIQPLAGQTIRLDTGQAISCHFDGSSVPGGSIYGFDGSREAEAVVKDILRQVGLPQNFVIKAANVPNAQAHISGGKRYILYSQLFMEEIYHKTGDYWSKAAVLAHEIAHHLLGHTLTDDGSRPVMELDADKWSGFVLFRMGASLVQAKMAVAALASGQGSATHPPRDARLEAIAVGYNEARELSGGKEESPAANQAGEQALKHFQVQLIVDAVFSDADFFVNDKPVYPLPSSTLTIKNFEIEGKGQNFVILAKSGNRECRQNFRLPNNFSTDPYPILLTCPK